ncbi:hypothetical protein D3C72_271290 [compost metagenome]
MRSVRFSESHSVSESQVGVLTQMHKEKGELMVAFFISPNVCYWPEADINIKVCGPDIGVSTSNTQFLTSS